MQIKDYLIWSKSVSKKATKKKVTREILAKSQKTSGSFPIRKWIDGEGISVRRDILSGRKKKNTQSGSKNSKQNNYTQKVWKEWSQRRNRKGLVVKNFTKNLKLARYF